MLQAGFPLANDESGYTSMEINMHLDNPSNIPGHIENSGFRMYVTKEARQYDAGSMELGIYRYLFCYY